jgi:hypothetical protein
MKWFGDFFGYFLLSNYGRTYSHSHEEHNHKKTDFKSNEGDTVKVVTNKDELWFINETQGWEFKMKIRLTEEEWQQAHFCVSITGTEDSMSIVDD